MTPEIAVLRKQCTALITRETALREERDLLERKAAIIRAGRRAGRAVTRARLTSESQIAARLDDVNRELRELESERRGLRRRIREAVEPPAVSDELRAARHEVEDIETRIARREAVVRELRRGIGNRSDQDIDDLSWTLHRRFRPRNRQLEDSIARVRSELAHHRKLLSQDAERLRMARRALATLEERSARPDPRTVRARLREVETELEAARQARDSVLRDKDRLAEAAAAATAPARRPRLPAPAAASVTITPRLTARRVRSMVRNGASNIESGLRLMDRSALVALLAELRGSSRGFTRATKPRLIAAIIEAAR